MKQKTYKETVRLLLEVLPLVLQHESFALKGGTAINLFHRDLTRLSVDIDLCYLPLENREATYKNIHNLLSEVKTDLQDKLNLKVFSNFSLGGYKEVKLFVQNNNTRVKIEPNYILRGSLFEPEVLPLSPKTQEEFQRSLEVQCLGLADTYGGKICAALDRQHPRDLFDIKHLLDNEGINTDIKDSFLLYLISHPRPIDEILSPRHKDISLKYEEEFVSMTDENIPLSELVETRSRLILELQRSLGDIDKQFLESFVRGTPDWGLVRDSKIQKFPSVR